MGDIDDTPWENADGSTNVDGFLAAYAADDNTFWRVEQGHIMNVLDEVLGRLDDERARSARWREALRFADDRCRNRPHCFPPDVLAVSEGGGADG